ncbi:30S ribosomal protein S3 [Mycoplasmoides gallisepticum]|uniref:Small ribosomal subunit protein uS3 n=3 Tax=Mycoplasmoides gallisepticum TaxID=2096 RepID=RS3_MYCGA|nr:30S ribosomal protein S3 [Mycoplasmoides gallisepticum]O52338.3 RecName: Full=Small ribosomal subunit protein uS3; AltName: Full=30S ribosomal protein S3 [Mycoplasmoides gallisepticum str. R(low)]AAB95393.1 ribosomal protein S3 [Mycoplasmoides gallisepticum]AAP56407.2 30S ribosomal protein S3 [Mycoplasmoides gallisepticum str. R(low)]ADC30239.1 30S ribosomal protein S3 [Mycoplasmoides gallisepticum str. R(high)]ADC31005.1 30S ribosomal protein S3 [Mycoplasmoides gallisepticum str. F]AHB993
MGQKVNSNGLRFGINKNWQSRWVAKTNQQTGDWIVQDEKIRNYLFKKFHSAFISNVDIERTQTSIRVFIYASQPGIILGKEAANIKVILLAINKIVGRHIKVDVDVLEVGNPSLSAKIVARELADAIENRTPLRTAMRQALKRVLKAGAKGIKVLVSGRLNGVEIARDKMYIEGNVTLSTLRTDIDYALEEAQMSYGVIGVKVWINRGEIFGKDFYKKQAHIVKPKGSEANHQRRNSNKSKDYRDNKNKQFNKNHQNQQPAKE